MTWGQIRFQITQLTPGLNPDVVDGWLNTRYESVLEAGDWTGIHAKSSITTAANVDVYTLPPDCRSVERILDPVTGYPLEQFTPAELAAFEGLPPICRPQAFAVVEDEAEVTAQIGLHQVQLYPMPDAVYSFPVEYLRSAFGLDPTNLSASPLAFVSTAILLYGVRADIAMAAGKLDQARAYESKFQEELVRLLRVEHSQRRAKPSFRMADRFTRHRLERLVRGFISHRF